MSVSCFIFGLSVGKRRGEGKGGGMNYDRCPAATQARLLLRLMLQHEDCRAYDNETEQSQTLNYLKLDSKTTKHTRFFLLLFFSFFSRRFLPQPASFQFPGGF